MAPYRRGWVNAFPTDETLKKLGLDECVGM